MEGLVFSVSSINCDADGGLCRDLRVKSFPTIMVIEKDDVFVYSGSERSLEAIAAFASGGYLQAERLPLPRAAQKSLLPRRGGPQKRKLLFFPSFFFVLLKKKNLNRFDFAG
jgi:hypothetical protein